MRDFNDYSLLAHNTFGIDAHCSRFLEFRTIPEARRAARILRKADTPFLIIGEGSNLLLTKDFPGIVVRSAIKGVTILGNTMYCGSGEVWDDMVALSIEHGLYGLENLSLIPGDVGASAVQNIGAYGAEAKDFISQVWAIDIATGTMHIIDRKDCCYGYRDSRFKHEWKNRYLIVQVVFELSQTFTPRLSYGNIGTELQRRGIDTPTAQQVRQTIIDIRNAKLPDPKVLGNAGSFFMNPVVPRQQYEALAAQYPSMPHYTVDDNNEKIPAGWLIEQCGWKGRSLGRAGVHDKQALVLVNRGGATGQDIVTLCETICRDVRNRFGIDIHPEVNII